MMHVVANISLLPTHQGGRRSFIYSGYRPNIRFSDDLYVDGAITFSDREQLFPGEKWQVTLVLPPPQSVKQHLKVGVTFDINEGAHKIGEGEIVALSV